MKLLRLPLLSLLILALLGVSGSINQLFANEPVAGILLMAISSGPLLFAHNGFGKIPPLRVKYRYTYRRI